MMKNEPSKTQEGKSQESGVFRVQKRDRFTTLENGMLRDKRLSFAARGLLAYLLSRPDNWEARLPDLVSQSPAGRDAVQTMIRELRKFGYMRRDRIRLPDGKFKYETLVFELPELDDAPHDAPLTENPVTAEPHTGFPVTAEPEAAGPLPENPSPKEVLREESLKEERSKEERPSEAEYSRSVPPQLTPPLKSSSSKLDPFSGQAFENVLCEICCVNPSRPSVRDREAWPETVTVLQSQSAIARMTPEELAGALREFRDWWFATPAAGGARKRSLYLSNVATHFPRWMQFKASEVNPNGNGYDDPATAGKRLRDLAYGRKG